MRETDRGQLFSLFSSALKREKETEGLIDLMFTIESVAQNIKFYSKIMSKQFN